MTFRSSSWKCYWHSNDLLHVPVDYWAICQLFFFFFFALHKPVFCVTDIREHENLNK